MNNIVIFIRNRRFLGTQIITFPVLYVSKQLWPDCQIRVVSRHPLDNIYNQLPWVDKFIYANNFFNEWQAVNKETLGMISLQPSTEVHPLIAFSRRPPTRIGFSNRRFFDLSWTHSENVDNTTYRALNYLTLLKNIQSFDIHKAIKDTFRILGNQQTIKFTKKINIILMPGAGGGEHKKWGIDNFINLTTHIKNNLKTDVDFFYVIGPSEEKELQAINKVRRPDFQTVVNMPLATLTELVNASNLVIANDCGPSHIAQCAGVPYVGIYDQNKPEWYWPRDESICLTPATPQENIKNITVSQVLENCLNLLPQALKFPSLNTDNLRKNLTRKSLSLTKPKISVFDKSGIGAEYCENETCTTIKKSSADKKGF